MHVLSGLSSFGQTLPKAIEKAKNLKLSPIAAALMLSVFVSTQAQAETCPVLESADWKVWVDKMSGKGTATLNVSAQLVLPTPGFRFEISSGPLDRKRPPTQRLILRATPPGGIVLQALTTEQINVQLPALKDGYASVDILCADILLAAITQIDVVQ